MAVAEVPRTTGLLPSMWRYRWLSLFVIAVVTALSGAAGLLTAPPVSATADFVLKNPGENSVLAPGAVGDATLTRYTQQRAQFATSDAVLEIVSAKLGGSLSELRKEVTVEPTTGSNQLTVTAKGRTPEDAVRLAEAVVAAYAQATEAEVTKRTAAAVAVMTDSQKEAGSSPARLQQQITDLRSDSEVFGDGVDFVRKATIADAVAPGPPFREIALGLIIGIVVAAVVAWLRADRDRRVLVPEGAEALLDAPLLASVPRDGIPPLVPRVDGRRPETAVTLKPPGPQYRLVTVPLLARVSPGMLAVMAPGAPVERSGVALNLALAVALDGGRVLLVDADPARPVSQRLGRGVLFDVFPVGDGEAQGPDSVALITVRDGVTIALATPGGSQGQGLPMASREFVDKLVQQHTDYDVVVIDIPAPETTSLAPTLVAASTGILAVIPRGSEEHAVQRLHHEADLFSTPVLGYVYTGMPEKTATRRGRSPARR